MDTPDPLAHTGDTPCWSTGSSSVESVYCCFLRCFFC